MDPAKCESTATQRSEVSRIRSGTRSDLNLFARYGDDSGPIAQTDPKVRIHVSANLY